MNGIAIVRRVDREHGRVDVVVYPASCGRCETDGGHCARDQREVPVQMPEDFDVRPGDHVRLGSSGHALRRSIGRLIVAPVAAALGGFYIGGGRFGRIAPRAMEQISGHEGVSLSIPGVAIGLSILGIGIAVFVAIRRGVQPADWPIVVERLPPKELFQRGGVDSGGSAARDSNPA